MDRKHEQPKLSYHTSPYTPVYRYLTVHLTDFIALRSTQAHKDARIFRIHLVVVKMRR